MYFTVNSLGAHPTCFETGQALLAINGKAKTDDAPIAILEMLDIMGLDDAVFCLRGVKGRDERRAAKSARPGALDSDPTALRRSGA